MQRIEPGIEWRQTSGRTHRVTIRREPEIVVSAEYMAQAKCANLQGICQASDQRMTVGGTVIGGILGSGWL